MRFTMAGSVSCERKSEVQGTARSYYGVAYAFGPFTLTSRVLPEGPHHRNLAGVVKGEVIHQGADVLHASLHGLPRLAGWRWLRSRRRSRRAQATASSGEIVTNFQNDVRRLSMP